LNTEFATLRRGSRETASRFLEKMVWAISAQWCFQKVKVLKGRRDPAGCLLTFPPWLISVLWVLTCPIAKPQLVPIPFLAPIG
jgi:hypothetical protein